jgi:hypothetical protein
MIHEHPADTRRVLVRSRGPGAGPLAGLGALALAGALAVVVVRAGAPWSPSTTAAVAAAERAVRASACCCPPRGRSPCSATRWW